MISILSFTCSDPAKQEQLDALVPCRCGVVCSDNQRMAEAHLQDSSRFCIRSIDGADDGSLRRIAWGATCQDPEWIQTDSFALRRALQVERKNSGESFPRIKLAHDGFTERRYQWLATLPRHLGQLWGRRAS